MTGGGGVLVGIMVVIVVENGLMALLLGEHGSNGRLVVVSYLPFEFRASL